MTSSRKTKRAWLSSVVALLLCLAMLMGTTFAWFTDSASTGINKIQSGKLDLVLEVATGFETSLDGTKIPVTWTEVTEEMKLFTDVNGNDILWEPGARAEQWFRIRNNGNLALKYQLKTNYKNATETADGKTLADILTIQNVAYEIEGGDYNGRANYQDITGNADVSGYAPMKAAKFEEYLLPGEARTLYTCVVWQPTDHDNDFNVRGGLKIDLGLAVVATQYTYEYDSIDNQYDKDAGYGNGWDGTVATEADLLAVVSEWNDSEGSGRLFTISSPELLAAYARYVNEGKGTRADKVVLSEDIDLGNQPWTPIGTTAHPFDARIFDGQGHTISNLKVNGGANDPTDLTATNQGLFGYTWTNGNIIEIRNLTIHNVDIYAKNSAGAVVGQVMTDQSGYWLAGYTALHHVNLTGKVTIEGGNSGGLTGAGTGNWALQTQYSDIVIDVDAGSYVSNVKAAELSGDGVGGALGSVASTVAWGRVVNNVQSNLDVIGISGIVGGIIGIGNQYFENITYTGNVTVKGVTPSADGKYNSVALVTGILAPTWNHSSMTDARRNSISATGTLTIELTDGTTVHSNGQGDGSKFGGWAW